MAVEKNIRLAASVVVVTSAPGCFADTITNPPAPGVTESDTFDASGEEGQTLGDESSDASSSTTAGDGDADGGGDGDGDGGGDGDGDAEDGGDGDGDGEADAGGDGDGDGDGDACADVSAELLTGSPYFEALTPTMCEAIEGWWPDESFYISDQVGYAAYQALWAPTQDCIDQGNVDPWPVIDFQAHDLLVLGSSPGDGCEIEMQLDAIEDCDGTRTVSANVYWCGPCEATVTALQVYRLPKTSSEIAIDISLDDGGVGCT